MGYRVSWIARSGTSTEELLKLAGRSPSGERHDFPDVGFYLLELPNRPNGAWSVLIADGSENYGALEESHAQALSSQGAEVLYFWCSDTVMATELACYRSGALAWSLRYDCEDEGKRPAIGGKPPAVVQQVHVRLREQQEADPEADYIYELTADVGRTLVGFRHDMDPDTEEEEPFQVLS